MEDDISCSKCGGEGYLWGYEMPGFDYVNDDPEEAYECAACRGSGLAKDQTIW